MKKLFFYIGLFLTLGLSAQTRVSAPLTDSTLVDSTTFILKQTNRTYAIRFDSIRSTLKTYFDGIYVDDISSLVTLGTTQTITGQKTFSANTQFNGAVGVNGDLSMSPGQHINTTYHAYGGDWNGLQEVPTKDALYDKFESLSISSTAATTTYDNTDSNLVATDVKSALDELDTLKIPDAPADSNDYVRNNNSWVEASGASPAGSDTEIQFNDGGSFGSDSNLKWDDSDTSILLGNTGKLKTYNASNLVALESLTGKNIRITTHGSGDHLGINSGNTDVSSIYLGASFSSKNAIFQLRGGNAATNTDATEYVRFEQKSDGLNIDLYKGFYWFNGGAFLFNTDQGNHDFRVYGQSDQYLIRADVSADRVGIGVSVPTQKVDVDGNVKADTFITNTYTFATLPTATTGMLATITDANSISYRGVASGGGSDTALVFYDGTNWIYH